MVPTELLITVATLQENAPPEMAISANLKGTRNGHGWPGCLAASGRLRKGHKYALNKDVLTDYEFLARNTLVPTSGCDQSVLQKQLHMFCSLFQTQIMLLADIYH